ncbi:hypothetical protein JQ607_24150 [Bradyrhizobium liaoningense]|uniref:hypothetical protein n=1 Tax=Bradyrhizobium liaoningense TaxID=43992 RepID=UPI001BA81419|nr:hypothetical protein [Bradyrhizobium liaoningense]MBR0843302.1 hypothetical protein [Bradyrhizobium liaoningense]
MTKAALLLACLIAFGTGNVAEAVLVAKLVGINTLTSGSSKCVLYATGVAVVTIRGEIEPFITVRRLTSSDATIMSTRHAAMISARAITGRTITPTMIGAHDSDCDEISRSDMLEAMDPDTMDVGFRM